MEKEFKILKKKINKFYLFEIW